MAKIARPSLKKLDFITVQPLFLDIHQVFKIKLYTGTIQADHFAIILRKATKNFLKKSSSE